MTCMSCGRAAGPGEGRVHSRGHYVPPRTVARPGDLQRATRGAQARGSHSRRRHGLSYGLRARSRALLAGSKPALASGSRVAAGGDRLLTTIRGASRGHASAVTLAVFKNVRDSLSATVPAGLLASACYVVQDHPVHIPCISRADTSSQLPAVPSQRSPAANATQARAARGLTV